MNRSSILKILATANVTVGILLPLWWICMGFGLPVKEAAADFDMLITHANWVPVNLIGMAACLVWLLSLPSLLLFAYERSGILAFPGTVCAGIGAALFTAIQYYETFIWPVVARTNPELLKIDGALVFGSRLVLAPLLFSGVILGIGYLLLGIDLIQKRRLPRPVVLMLTIGGIVFGNGIVVPVRTLGMLSFAAAMVWIGVIMHRHALTGVTSGNLH